MMAFLEFTFRSGSHFLGMCFLIFLTGMMLMGVVGAFRGSK